MSDNRAMRRAVMTTMTVMIQASLVLVSLFVEWPIKVAAQTITPPVPLIRDAWFDAQPVNIGTVLKNTRPFDMIRQDNKRLVAGTACPIAGYCSNIVLARYLPTGELDPAFGDKGVVQFEELARSYPSFATVRVGGSSGLFGVDSQQGGKVVVEWQGGPYGLSLEMARFNANGMPDLSFGVGGILTDTNVFGPSALAVQADDKIVVGSNWATTEGYYLQLNRYTADGRLDDSFGEHGVVRSTNLRVPNQVLIQPDQKIVAVSSGFSGAAWSSRIMRFLPNGQIDLGFGINGIVEDACPAPCNTPSQFKLLQVDAHLYRLIARYTAATQGDGRYGNLILQRFNADGSIDSTLGSNGQISVVTPNYTSGFADFQVMPDQRLIVFITPSYSGTAPPIVAARYKPTGALDPSFGHNGVLEQSFGDVQSAIVRTDVDADGRLTLLGTSESRYNTSATMVIAQLNLDGTFDPSYGNQGMARLSLWGNSDETLTGKLLFQPDRKVIAIVQNQNNQNGVKPYFHMVRYNADGSLDATFGNQGILSMTAAGQTMQVADAVLQPNGAIVVAGGLNNDAALVRYLPNGQPDPVFGVSGMITTSGPLPVSLFTKVQVQPDGRLLSQIDNTPLYEWATPTSVLMRFTPTGERDWSFGAQGLYTGTWQRGDFQLLPDQSIVVIDWQYGERTLRLTALDQAGHLNPNFGNQGVFTYQAPNSSIGFCDPFRLIPQADFLLIDIKIAYPSSRGASCSYDLLRVTPEGEWDISFGTSGLLSIPYHRSASDIVAAEHGIYILENYSYDCWFGKDQCPTTGNFLWRYAPDGTPDSKTRVWVTYRGQPWPAIATGIALQPDDLRHGIFVSQQVFNSESRDINITHLISATHAVPVPVVLR